MADWPQLENRGLARGLLSPFGDTPLGDLLALSGLGASATTGVWTANRAVYQPVWVVKPVVVTDMAISVATQSGNVDVGIYDFAGTRLVSTGSTAMGPAGTQKFDIANTALAPGWYYLAVAVDNATAVLRNSTLAAGQARICGLREQASAFPLPATATFAVYTTALFPLVIASYSPVF